MYFPVSQSYSAFNLFDQFVFWSWTFSSYLSCTILLLQCPIIVTWHHPKPFFFKEKKKVRFWRVLVGKKVNGFHSSTPEAVDSIRTQDWIRKLGHGRRASQYTGYSGRLTGRTLVAHTQLCLWWETINWANVQAARWPHGWVVSLEGLQTGKMFRAYRAEEMLLVWHAAGITLRLEVQRTAKVKLYGNTAKRMVHGNKERKKED